MDFGIGHITTSDMLRASQTGAVILGFDVPLQPEVDDLALTEGVCIKLYKGITQFSEDMKNFVHDSK